MKRRVGIWIRLKAFLIWLLVRLLLVTVRIRVLHPERLRAAHEKGGPVLYAFWHGRQLPLFKANPEKRLAVMTSLSRDGEMQARICRRFGLEVVRGSSSRGALGGLIALTRLLKSGRALGMAVDGPRGPAFEAKPGVATLARQSGSPILPVTAGARRGWVLRRAWDRFQIPCPFTIVTVVYGEPIWVPKGASPAELRCLAESVTASLRRWTTVADECLPE